MKYTVRSNSPHLSANQVKPFGLRISTFFRPSDFGLWNSALICLLFTAMAIFSSRAPAQTNFFPEFRVETARDYLQSVSQAVWEELGTNAESCFLQARLQSQLGRKDLAERLARQSLSLEPKRAEVEIFLADIFIHEDRLPDAEQCLRHATELAPQINGGYRRLGMVLDRLGDRPGAKEAFTKAAQLAPDDATARLLLGRLLLDQGQTREALQHLVQATQIDPGQANAYYALYQAQHQAGEDDAARKTLEIFQQLKKKEKSEMDNENSAYDNDQLMRGFTADFHSEAAKLLGRQGKTVLAEAHLQQAIRVAPQEPRGHEMLGEFYIKQNRLSDARPVFEELVRLRPEQVDYRINLSTLLLRLKDYPAAEKELKQVLERNPKQSTALNNLARLYLSNRRELPEALELSQRLAASEPSAANFDLLSWALYSNARTNEAIAAMAKAVQQEPTNSVYRQHYQRLEKTVGAAK